jgi:hypothetical protein
MGQALITGTATDEAITVYAIGRDFDSGTRLTTLAETGIGAKSSVNQNMPSKVVGSTSAGDQASATTDTIADIVQWPAGSVNGVSYIAGNGGYASGGNLVKAIAATNTVANSAMVGYAGTGDANKAGQGIDAGAVELSYNGVKLGTYNSGTHTVTDDANLIAEGKYTFWGYEHVYYNTGATAGVKSVAQRLADQLASGGVAGFATPDAPAPLLKNMKVSRGIDGGIVSQNY